MLSMGCWLDDMLFKSFTPRGGGTHAGDAEWQVGSDFTGHAVGAYL
jgi:hypothetical protein